MLSRALHVAFDRAIAHDSWIAGEAALSGIDPLLAIIAKRKLRNAALRATQCTIVNAPSHTLRLAALFALGKASGLDVSDEAGVLSAYQALGPVPTLSRKPWFSLAALLIVCSLVAACFVITELRKPFDPNHLPQGQILGAELSEFVVAAADRDQAALRTLRARLVGASTKTLSEATRQKFAAMLDSAERLATAEGPSENLLHALHAATVQFDQALARDKLPFFVDSEALVRPQHLVPLLMSSYIERERVFEVGGKKIRAIHLWRLDKLRVRFSYLGYTRPHTPAAIVLLDQTESDLVKVLLPALAPKESMHLVDEETRSRGDAWAIEIEAKVAEALRKHVRPNAALTRVATLVARRRALVKSFRERLSGQGMQLVEPERLIPEHDYVADLAIRIPRSELREWQSIHEQLLEPEPLEAFITLRDIRTTLTERHEVQHRIEYSRELVPVPDVLCKRLGLQNPLDAPEGSLPERAKTELAAYLVELATAQGAFAAVEIATLSGQLLDKFRIGGAYSYATLALLELIAGELGIDVEAIIGTGRITPPMSARLLESVLARSPADLQKAAARAYEKAFGQPVPVVRLLHEQTNPAWRH